ncbi:hypothetical protein [Bacillus solimangrovi]|nr:hypothetical protein [Bacillus solimangrovi]
MAFFFIGLSQLIYMIPALIWAAYKKRTSLLQGMLIGMGITFLVNSACFGIIFGGY